MEKTKQFYIEEFEKFLKRNNCYDEFVKNVITLRMDKITKIEEYYEGVDNMFEFVIYAFDWSKTGDCLKWDILDDKWKEKVNNLNK